MTRTPVEVGQMRVYPGPTAVYQGAWTVLRVWKRKAKIQRNRTDDGMRISSSCDLAKLETWPLGDDASVLPLLSPAPDGVDRG